jgi:1-acyl-sn-glycerol-3-phosphate acyltransferase
VEKNMDQYLMRPADLPTWGQRTSLRLLNLFGWKFRWKPLPGPHGIAVVYPHTSNWDFFVGLLAKWAVGLAVPLAGQGLAVPRSDGRHHALLGRRGDRPQLAPGRDHAPGQDHAFVRRFWLAITPEGTRGYRPYWKSGFYRIARRSPAAAGAGQARLRQEDHRRHRDPDA